MERSTWQKMFALIYFCAQAAFAQPFNNYTWVGNSSSWDVSSNWDGNEVPASSDQADIGDTTNIAIPTITTTQSVYVISFFSSGGYLYIADSGNLTIDSNMNVGNSVDSTANVFFTGTGIGGSLTFPSGAYAMQAAGQINYHVTGNSPNTITFSAGSFGQSEGTANIVNASSAGGTLGIGIEATSIVLNSFNLQSEDTVNLGDSSTLSLLGESSISGVISGGGNLVFNSSARSLVLSGSNTYTGSTTISGGTLALSGTGSIAASSAVSVANDAIFDISGTSSGATVNDLSGSGFVLLGTQTLTINENTPTSFTGRVQEEGNLVLSGTSTLTLSGSNTYRGSTTVASGTLALTGTGSIAYSDATQILAPGSLDISQVTSYAVFNNLIGNGTVFAGSSAQTLVVNGTGFLPVFLGSIQDGGIVGGTGANFFLEGTLALLGTNTYTGSTTVAGYLLLAENGSIASSSGVNILTNSFLDVSNTIPGTTINNLSGSGFVSLGSSDQTLIVYETSPTTFSGVMRDGGFPNTNAVGGNFAKSGPATLTLSGLNNYTGSTFVQEGTLALLAEGSVASSRVFVLSSAIFDISETTSEALIQGLSGFGTVSLGGSALTVYTTLPSNFSGTIQDGGIGGGTAGQLFKSGPATFILSGINTYTGNTTVQEGTLLVNGSITSDVMVYDGATLGGAGTVEGSVSIDSLAVLTHGSTFTIRESAYVYGTIDLGDEASEIVIGENLVLESGSILNIYIGDSGNSLVSVGGSIMIDSSSTVNFLTVPGYNLLNHDFIFMRSDSGDVFGQFSTITANTILIHPIISYFDGYVVGNYVLANFPSLISQSNALHVAASLKEEMLSRNAAFGGVFASLLPLDASDLTTAFNQMQPALLKALAISSENNVIKVHDGLGFRFQQELDQVHSFSLQEDWCERNDRTFHVWVNGFGDILRQKSINYHGSLQTGYQTHTGGVALGIDGRFAKYFYLGALGAYTGSDVDWTARQASADIDTGYGGIYFSALGDLFYVNTAVIGGWSHYHAKRDIFYPGTYAVAKSNHGGSQILSHIDLGINSGVSGISIRPFNAFDYISQTEHSFTETGAGVFNLHVNGSNEIMLRNELGLQLASCFCLNSSKWTLSPKISWVREVRVKGSQYTASFVDATAPFTVTGYFPDRSLVSPGVMVTGVVWDDRLTLDLYYNGEFGQKYTDHNYGGQIRVGF